SKLGLEGDDFLKKVLAVIVDRVKTDPFKWTGEMKIRNIILSAHSGGGTTMRRLTETVTVGKICECWALDSLYNAGAKFQRSKGVEFYKGLTPWIDFAAQGGKLFIFWTDEGGTEDNVRKLEGMLATSDPTVKLAAPNIVIEEAAKPKTFAKAT